jgi:hypothetical protein
MSEDKGIRAVSLMPKCGILRQRIGGDVARNVSSVVF